MCGITGFIDSTSRASDELAATAERMASAIRHRGPDDSGVWVDDRAGVALGHRRLSIIDLTKEGHQPMHSAGGGRYAIVFNGEIYNFLELRTDLEGRGHTFRGHSDTEVMLAAIVEWGVRGALERFNGMFAFALWDREERKLHLARDRFGEKPLYYARMGSAFLFGSEMKALRAHPQFEPRISRDAVTLFLRHNYIPAPWSVFEGVHKLPAATLLTVGAHDRELPEPVPYWSAADVIARSLASPLDISEEEATNELDRLLRRAISLRMVADVPLGAFLSGGIDSSTVVALMQAQSSRPVKTFTIGFHESGFNEADAARAVARHLGTEHTELYLTPKEALDVVPLLPTLYDEPFADSSQVPTYLVSRLARRNVTVTLSGDGGDELFGGYQRYQLMQRIWGVLSIMPFSLRKVGGRAGRVIEGAVSALSGALQPFVGDPAFLLRVDRRLHRLNDVAQLRNPEDLYLELLSHERDPATMVRGSREPATILRRPEAWPRVPGLLEKMMFLDTVTYLPEDILTKVDRASMGVSLEARVPLLDASILEFSWRLPTRFKMRDGVGKWILRQVLYRYVPKKMVDRPKQGFGVPIDRWLSGKLRDWAESLLDPRRLESDGLFDVARVRQMWTDHLSGRRNSQYQLWDILSFQAWKAAGTSP